MISFKMLEQYLDNADLNLVLKKTETGIAVSVLPKPNIEDKAKENLIPLIVKGTAEELDQQFMQLISSQLETATGIITNIAEFEAQANEMKAKSEAQKKAKDNKKNADEKSKKELEGADKLLEEGKFDECQAKIDKALKDNAEYKPAITLQNKLDKAKPSDNQVDIFNVIEEETKEYPGEKLEKDENGKPIFPEKNTLYETKPPSEPVKVFVEPSESISIEKQEKVEQMLDEEEDISREIQEAEEPQQVVSIQEVHNEVVKEIEEKKEETIIEQTTSNQRPVRVDFESQESYENRLKLWEKTQAGELGLDEISEIAEASPNVQIVTLPPQEPKPIEPNNNFDSEPKNMSSISNPIMEDPGQIQEDMWAQREYNAQQNNNNNIKFH